MNVKFQNRIIIRQAHNKKVTKRFHISEGVLKYFAKFTGKHLSLFFNKVSGLRPAVVRS